MKAASFNASFTAILWLLCAHSSLAAELAQTPLFISHKVAANLLFITDDSSSMDSEMLIPGNEDAQFSHSQADGSSANDDGGIVQRYIINNDGKEQPCYHDINLEGFITRANYILEANDNTHTSPCLVAAEEEWRVRSHNFNHLYYDPEQTYRPWAGHDVHGHAYGDMSAQRALIDPYTPDKGWLNLLQDSALVSHSGRDHYHSTRWQQWCHKQRIPLQKCKGWRYYQWQDKDGDGRHDNSEARPIWLHEMNPAQQTNFANWFSYHRSRDFVTKYALSHIVDQSQHTRIGYATLNNDTHGIAIQENTSAQRQHLLTKIFQTHAQGETPLRQRLLQAGDYFENGGFFNLADIDSPILNADDGGSCQHNHIVVSSDGDYNDTLDHYQHALPGNADGDNNSRYDGGHYADRHANTLADIAMHYYERDLRPGLEDKVFAPGDDHASHQHINIHSIALGSTGELAAKLAPHDEKFPGWPDPTLSKAAKIDDLRHAAYNSRGTFFTADNPTQLIHALNQINSHITPNSLSLSATSFDNTRIKTDSREYQSQFMPHDWSGDVIAKTHSSSGKTQTWSAAEHLNHRALPEHSRTILSYRRDATSPHGIAFRWPNLNQQQRAALSAGEDANSGKQRLAYLRGSKQHEASQGGALRNRNSLLGDIIHSSPIYVAAPRMPYPDRTPYGNEQYRYSHFHSNMSQRRPVIYVGANDGALHAFDARSGEELMAYIPNTLIPKLAALTQPDYQHQYYVDQTPTISDVFIERHHQAAAWHTVLVSGLGAGGRGLFALDITQADNFNEDTPQNTVMWEFDHHDNPNLGYTLSKPTIALTKDHLGKQRWAAIIGNGYNSDAGIAQLLIIFLDPDLRDGWTLDQDYRVISTHSGNSSDKNGLSTPSVIDVNGDGIADRVYAGDLHGNLWAFDLSGEQEWQVAYTNNGQATPLFRAINAAGQTQAITVKPLVTINPDIPPNTQNHPNLMIYFGSGKYLFQQDASNVDTQTFYGIWDTGIASLSRNNLQAQQIEHLRHELSPEQEIELRITSNINIPYNELDRQQPGVNFGWLIDLDTQNSHSGERVIQPAKIHGNTILFTTFTPSTQACEGGGSTWLMFVNAHNGGLPRAPVIDIDGNLNVDIGDRIRMTGDGQATTLPPSGIRLEQASLAEITITHNAIITPATIRNETNDTNQGIRLAPNTVNNRRLSWRELRDK